MAHPDLPVDVEVVKFMKHADFKEPSVSVPNPATGGLGRDREMVAVEAQEQSGVDTSQRADITSAYVRLFKKGTNEEMGKKMLADSGLPIISADSMAEAAQKVMAALK